MSTGKRPDWSLCVRAEGDTKWTKIGVAWTSDKGNISLRLDRDGRAPKWGEEGVMLFPYREERPRQEREERAPYRPYRPVERPLPPIVDAATLVKGAPEDDYMERRRRERATPGANPAKIAPSPPDDEREPDPEPPEWL